MFEPRKFVLLTTLLCCAMTSPRAQSLSGTPGCGASDDIAASLQLDRTQIGPITAVQERIPIVPRWALVISGRCAIDLVGSRAGYFRLKSGASVELSAPVQDPNVRLRRSAGPTLVDSAKVVPVPKELRRSRLGVLVGLTSAASPSTGADRFAAVWSRPSGSLVGFLDRDRGTGRYTRIPLFEVPMKASIAYYLPSPDSNSGDFTVLGPVADGMKVMTVTVGM